LNERRKNQLEYETRVNRVMDHIQAHRAEALSLESLAAVAAFSPFHFHRIFKAMTGETVSEFVQRVRLESAAGALLSRPHSDILEVALDNGFSSASAFARAFKERFGMTASEWRAGGFRGWRKLGQADSKLGQADDKAGKAAPSAILQDSSTSSAGASTNPEEPMIPNVNPEPRPNVSLLTLPAYRVAYMRNVGLYGAGGGIPALWERLAKWATARDLWTADRVCVGISYDDPTVTDPAKCRYDAGIVVADSFPADGQVNITTIPAGKFAAAHFRGHAHEIGRAWQDLCGWLPGSGFQPADGPSFELYRGEAAVNASTGIFTCDVCLPVKPL
jgi:AraC family transcriptional regulator